MRQIRLYVTILPTRAMSTIPDVSARTGAEEVASVSEEAGHPDSMTPEVIAQWISTDYAPGMQQALAQGGAE